MDIWNADPELQPAKAAPAFVPEPAYSWSDAFRDASRLYNLGYNARNAWEGALDGADPRYDWREDPNIPEPHRGAFGHLYMQSRSGAETLRIRSRVDEESEAKRRLGEAGFWTEATASLLTGVLDPTSIFGPPGIRPGSSAVGNLFRSSAYMGAIQAGEQAALTAANPSQTPSDVAMTGLLGSTAFAALQAPIIAWNASRGARLPSEASDAFNRFDRAVQEPAPTVRPTDLTGLTVDDLRARATELAAGRHNAFDLRRYGDEPDAVWQERVAVIQRIDALEGRGGNFILSEPPTSGATPTAGQGPAPAGPALGTPRAPVAASDLGLVETGTGIEKLGVTPILRLLNASAGKARELGTLLVDHGMLQARNLVGRGDTPVSARIGVWNANLVEALTETDRLFADYRGKPGGGFFANVGLRISDAVSGPGAMMTRGQFNEAVSDAMRTGGRHAVPQVEQAATAWRTQVYNALGKEAFDLGIWNQQMQHARNAANGQMQRATIAGDAVEAARLQQQVADLDAKILAMQGTTPDFDRYLNRMWDRDAILADQGRIADIIAREGVRKGVFGNLRDALREAGAIVQDLLDKPPGFSRAVDDPVGIAGSLKQRKLDWLDDLAIREFLVNDVETLGRAYMRSVAPDVELTRMFGSFDLQRNIAEVAREYDALIVAARGDAQAVDRLTRQRDTAIADVRALRDILRGSYALPDNPYSTVSQGIRLAKTAAIVAQLGGQVITALGDVARPVMVEGIERTFGYAIRPLIQGIEHIKLGAREARLAGTAIDLVISSRGAAFADTGNSFMRATRLDRKIEGFTQGYFIANGISPWTDLGKSVTATIVQARIIETAQRFLDGTISQADKVKLARAGLLPADGSDVFVRLIAEHARLHGDVVKGVPIARTENWPRNTPADIEALRRFRAALASDVDRTIVTPKPGDAPLWMETEIGGLLGQYRRFALASTTKVLVAGLQNRDQAFMLGALGMVGLGMIGDHLRRTYINEDKRGYSTSQLVYRGVERSGLMGWFGDVNTILERASNYHVGLQPFLGLEQPRKQGMTVRGVVGAVPAASFAYDATRALYDLGPGDWDRRSASALRRVLPMQNVWWADGLFDQIEQSMRP